MTTLLPIVDRELRVASRRNKTYWLRLAAALAALVVSLWICLWTARTQPPATAGKWLFTYLSILGFAYCLLVGPFITSDCISEEKRDGTLGLLFLTELRSLDVVLGKWIASSLAGFYGLIAILPALGLPLLMGGVTPGEYVRTALAVVNAIFFSLAAGMWVSTLCRDQAKAVLGSVVVILGLSGLLPGLATVVASGFFTKAVNQLPGVALASPIYTGMFALDAAYRANPQTYWWSLGLVHGLAWLFLLGAAVLVPRVWREAPAEKPVKHRWVWRLGYTQGWRRTFRRRLERNPVFAAAARWRWPHPVFWGLVGIVAINVLWLTHGQRQVTGAGPTTHQHFVQALVFTNRVWITVMACRFFLEARRSGALELLLTTPLTVRTFLRGHWRSLWWYCFWPIVAIGVLHIFFATETARLNPPGTMGVFGTGRSRWLMAGNSYLNFLTDVFALCYVGAWLSLSMRRPTYAVLATFGSVILVPWTIGFILPGLSTVLPAKVLAFLYSQPLLRLVFAPSFGGFSLSRTVVYVSKNLAFILWARHCLHRHFRAAAAQTHRQKTRTQARGRARRQGVRGAIPPVPLPADALRES